MAVVRYVLSFLVLIAHTATLADVSLPISHYSFIAVGGFFALSGFLLFASFQKKPTLKHYISRRARRILPPYFLVVIVCALTFVLVSSLSWKEYYCSIEFWKYLAANLSFLNFIQPSLPGVFEGSEFYNPAVNGSLWTMKGEWICYISVPILFFFILKHPKKATLILSPIILLCIVISNLLYFKGEQTGKEIFLTLSKQFNSIFAFFYIGALINVLYKYFLKYKWYIIAIDIAIIIFSNYYVSFYHLVLRPFVVATLVIWFSQVGKWGYFLRHHEDLSYDIYLFHYPIIQLSVLFGLNKTCSPYILLLIIIAVTTLCAFISWNTLGKKILHRRI